MATYSASSRVPVGRGVNQTTTAPGSLVSPHTRGMLRLADKGHCRQLAMGHTGIMHGCLRKPLFQGGSWPVAMGADLSPPTRRLAFAPRQWGLSRPAPVVLAVSCADPHDPPIVKDRRLISTGPAQQADQGQHGQGSNASKQQPQLQEFHCHALRFRTHPEA